MTAPSSYTGGLYRRDSFFRDTLTVIGLLVLLMPAAASAQRIPTPIIQTTNDENLAFARYIAWLHARDPFTESGPVALAITAFVPGLNKEGSLLAIRDVGESERSEYAITELRGDSIVLTRVIVPYLIAQRQAEDLPLSSVLITPQNYRFRYAGRVDRGDSAAYIFQITPKKSRAGLIRGELWIDSVTGAPVHVTGQFVKSPSISTRGINVVREIAFVREITFVDGHPFARTTHMSIQTRPVGRANVTIVESPLSSDPESTGVATAAASTGSVTFGAHLTLKRWP
jgi:hypothetical protein